MNTTVDESSQLSPSPALQSYNPPLNSEADASSVLPPTAGHTHGTSTPGGHVTATSAALDRKATGAPKATSSTVKSPRRYLDPELAQAIKEAKLKTGASWRRVAKYTGLSHSYLVQLSNGQRVPSSETVEVLAAWLPIEEWAVESLRQNAGPPRS